LEREPICRDGAGVLLEGSCVLTVKSRNWRKKANVKAAIIGFGAITSMLRLCLCLCAAQSSPALSPGEIAAQVKRYRPANEQRIVAELNDLLAIPNTANDEKNMQRNAAKLVELLEKRGSQTKLLPILGHGPVVFGRLDTPGATRTVIFWQASDGNRC
jgi:hypothetical protein